MDVVRKAILRQPPTTLVSYLAEFRMPINRLARLSGVKYATCSGVASGRVNATLKDAKKIAAVFGVEVGEIFDMDSYRGDYKP